MVHWGVDSMTPADARAPGGNLFEHVVRECGHVPAFWGRYIGHRPSQIRDHELEFVARESVRLGAETPCRIAIVYNGVRRMSAPRIRGERGYEAGFATGLRAWEKAREVGIPAGIRIYCDLEGWRASTDWLRGWWDAMAESPYAGHGGLYGRTAEISHSDVSNPMLLDSLLTPRSRRVRYPEGFWSERSAEASGRHATGLDELMRGATGERVVGANTSKYVWTNIPRGPRTPDCRTFRGVSPPSAGQRAVVWQYAMDFLRRGGSGTGRIDMDLALDDGLREMWDYRGAIGASAGETEDTRTTAGTRRPDGSETPGRPAPG